MSDQIIHERALPLNVRWFVGRPTKFTQHQCECWVFQEEAKMSVPNSRHRLCKPGLIEVVHEAPQARALSSENQTKMSQRAVPSSCTSGRLT